jgi:putative copper export protein
MIDSALAGLSKWLSATSLSNEIQTTGWIIPALQTIHILGVAVLFSSAILVDLRVLRVMQRDAELVDVARRFLPVIWPVLLVLLVSGSLLIIGEPRRSLLNTTFYLKMSLLLVAIALTAGLQWSFGSTFWEKGQGRQVAGRLAAVLSILVWCGILFAGRWIAYTQAG